MTISVPFFVGRIMDSFITNADDPSSPTPKSFTLLNSINERMDAFWGRQRQSGQTTGTKAKRGSDQLMRDLVRCVSPKSIRLHRKYHLIFEGSVCVVLSVIFLVGAAANFGRSYLMISAGQLVTNRLRTSVYGAILRQEMAFFDKSKTGQYFQTPPSHTVPSQAG